MRECATSIEIPETWCVKSPVDFFRCFSFHLKPTPRALTGMGEVPLFPPNFGPGPAGAVSASANFAGVCWLLSDGTPICQGASALPGKFSAMSVFGYLATCGIKLDGSLACNDFFLDGHISTPPSGQFSEVVVGNLHACAIRSDGTLLCWGSDDYAHFTPPADQYHGLAGSCALRNSDNSIACFDGTGALSLPAGTPPGAFTSIGFGFTQGCGLRPDGNVECWGGALTPPPGPFKQLGVSHDYNFDYACGLRLDGSLSCWNQLVR